MPLCIARQFGYPMRVLISFTLQINSAIVKSERKRRSKKKNEKNRIDVDDGDDGKQSP